MDGSFGIRGSRAPYKSEGFEDGAHSDGKSKGEESCIVFMYGLCRIYAFTCGKCKLKKQRTTRLVLIDNGLIIIHTSIAYTV